ncbi:hypothetical protein [Pseudomonas aeruginosa]|uniref:hypothetical protein n=1 Tax=Pseudomonas aeruginosa TaxID=287 RepID=UPI001BC8CB3A|nr:hypothetical protein [Pseudomonas aeruginosa]HBO1351764.1 hypothetical protein [Pseudomonas aeruginosa]
MSELNKESVEQAGGDERAAFEVWASPLGWKLSPDQNNCGIVVAERYGHPGVQRCWEAWQARAALAQPSPAQAEKAEVERTEGSADLLAIVREAVAGAYNEWKMISEAVTEIMEAHERIVGELRADRDSWAEQAEQRLADWDEMRKERDAALARVKALEALVAARIKDVPVDAPVIAVVGDFNEEQVHECKRFHDAIRAQRNPKAIVVFLNSKNDIQAVDEAAMCAAGWVRAEAPVAQAEQAPPSEDQLIAAGLSYPLAKEDAVKLWYSGFRSEVITVLEAWEAIGHDIGMNPDKGELLDSLRYMLEKCEAHDAALARVAELTATRNRYGVDAHYFNKNLQRILRDFESFTSDELARSLIILAKVADEKVVAQAQHSAPEVSGIGRDTGHPRAVVLYLRKEPTDDDLRAIHDALRSLAAAPGKEGV